MTRDPICDRLAAVFEKARARKLVVGSLYLDEKDRAELERAQECALGELPDSLVWRGTPVRAGKASRLYSQHGVGLAVPRRLSRRTKPR